MTSFARTFFFLAPPAFALARWAQYVGALSLAWLILPVAAIAEEEIGLKAPPGFQVTKFADDSLAHDIYSMTIDSLGRVVVSGPGYVKILIDSDGDGKADKTQTFADGPASGAQGLYFLGRDLLCTGDAGLIRYRDANGDDRADGPPDVFLKVKTGHEHSAHAIRRGPDGRWYVIAGNMTEVTTSYITGKKSPIKQPYGGVLLRLKPDLTGGEVFADGLRNAYDFDFNEQGEVFIYDSDGERDVSLPWYLPTRLFHTVPGTNHGWVTESWKRPNYYLDAPAVVAETGRGSPTGVACYRHTQFPEKYQGSLFVLDWTFGRVFAIKPQRQGDTYQGAAEEFLSIRGQFGFAPTDIEVGMDGSLYICVGGRGTHGTVYRVTYTPNVPPGTKADKLPAAFDGINANTDNARKLQACLTAPQPASSWSRGRWVPWAKQVGEQAFMNAALNEELPTPQRIRAIEILTDQFNGIPETAGEILSNGPTAELRARAIWSLGLKGPETLSHSVIVGYLSDGDPLVRRCALEALEARTFNPAKLIRWFARCLNDESRLVRLATARLIPDFPQPVFKELSVAARKLSWRAATTNVFGYLHRDEAGENFDKFGADFARRVLEGKFNPQMKLESLRLLQRSLGDLAEEGKTPAVFEGYSCSADLVKHEKEVRPIREAVAKLYPSGNRQLDIELSRAIAILALEDARVLDRVLDQISNGSHPTDDMHHLIVAARIGGKRTSDQRTALAQGLLGLEPKLKARQMQTDTHWNDRLNELYAKLVDLDPDLPRALIEQPGFGRPGQILFMSKLNKKDLPKVVEIYFKAATTDKEYGWTNDVVFVIGEGKTPNHYDLIREQFEKFELRMAILMVLSANPQEADRSRFVSGLDSAPLEILETCLTALEKMPAKKDPEELAGLIKLIRRLGNEKRELSLRERAAKILERNSGEKFGFASIESGTPIPAATIESCTKWLTKNYPQQAEAALGGNAAELKKLEEMIAAADWRAGDVERGRKLFNSRGCAQCHTGGGAVGPDLSGVAGRFSREDLFIAIAVPSRDVSPRYQTMQIETKAGKTITGLIVYEAVDGLLLRNGTNQTFRIETKDIESRRNLPTSLMPEGLLKDLKPTDLTDLFAFLRSLAPRTATLEQDDKSARKE